MRENRIPQTVFFSARRFVRSLIAAGVAALFAGGVLGFAAAGEPHGDPPDKFGVPYPTIGDRGAYSLTPVRDVGGVISPTGPEREVVRFEWLPPDSFRDSHGHVVLANRLWLSQDWHGATRPPNVKPVPPSIKIFNVEDGLLLADQTPNERSGPAVEGNHTVFFDPIEPWPTLCGLLSPLQGAARPTSGEVFRIPQCELPVKDKTSVVVGAFGDNQGLAFHTLGTERLDGRDTVAFEARRDFGGRELRVILWYTAEIPYPLRAIVQRFDDVTTYNVIRLTSLSRGHVEIAHHGTPASLASTPALTFAAREVWGPSDQGLPHAFPLSAAFRWARDDPRSPLLRGFLEANPEAYVFQAEFNETHTGPESNRTWSFGVTNGVDDLILGVYEWTRVPLYRQTRVEDLRRVLAPEVVRGYANGSAASVIRVGESRLDPGLLPDSAPTLASFARVWEAYASADKAARGFNAWGFAYRCWWQAPPCAESDPSSFFKLTGGFESTHTHYSPGSQGFENRTVSLLEIDGKGRVHRLFESHESAAQRTLLGAPEATGLIQTPRAQTIQVSLWSLPAGAYAAATGLAALIAAIAYWFVAGVRHLGGIALFSRIEKPTATEQPTRAHIMELIEAEPGIHHQELIRRSGRSDSTVTHHLRKLAGLGLVVAKSGNRYTCYFAKGIMNRPEMAHAQFLKSPVARRLIELARERPIVSAAAAARSLGVRRQTLAYHLGQLERQNLITVQRARRRLKISTKETPRIT